MQSQINACLLPALAAGLLHAAGPPKIDLINGWNIQSSAKVVEAGDEISTARYEPRDWYAASIPSTVVAALVNHKVYPDPYFGMNLRSFPGVGYNVGQNFSNLPMPADSPFNRSWWYRTQFSIPQASKGKRLWLNFEAINYRANIWLNGHKLAGSDQVAGMYRMFEFDVTGTAMAGGTNVLAVEVFPPTQTDLTITYVDWNPMPPDKDMGLVRDVYILTSGPVALRDGRVTSKVDTAADKASLTISADLKNASAKDLDGLLKAQIGATVISKKVHLAANETARVSFSPETYPQLNVSHPKLWWPYPLGPQNLYQLKLDFETGAMLSDREEIQFGIREITSEVDARKHRLFKINGRNILIRGGGWTSDMMLRVNDEREEQEIRYAQEMNLNTIRLEGKMMNEHFFNTCDRKGILVIAGWCCCSYWERWTSWKDPDYAMATESLRDQIRKIQNHASVLAWLYGSDNSPNAKAEAAYLKVLREEDWPNPFISSAAAATTEGAGPTGVKMTGPYEYVAPNYWLEDRQRGGAIGFNTETSPGPAIPVLESLAEMLPKEHLWPIDQFWGFHAGGGGYRNVNVFTAALEGRYGKAKGLEDYVRKNQLMTYEGERAMFEAYGRKKYEATGVVQWMLNNARPSMIWHLYDYYLRPGGGYFGARKANEPLHVQYSYDDQSIAVVNSFYQPFSGLSVTAKVYNLDLTEKFSKTQRLDVAPDSTTPAFTLPFIEGLSKVYFVKLSLQDPKGKQTSSNFYWLSTQPDVSDWAKGNGRYTPISTYADLTGLETLPQAGVMLASRTETKGNDGIAHVTVSNPSRYLAFFIHLTALNGKDGADIHPIYWDDNYFELMPGEKRSVNAAFPKRLLGASRLVIKADGWNLPTVTQ